ncbi:Copper transporter MctB precursor [Corynebacterium capitovis DSM 44611]|uniref:copper transporter n=1 Tax=Corynebacterium capitovis TaxID=131081 RepID=UPI00037B32F9|nr:copper transporter [Corynebacterium capitovis]WKD57717.1 Copper transporter MctB precursor [Corynebacterium capitovis DSM 44611]
MGHQRGRAAFVLAGLGWGLALGTAFGVLALAPAMQDGSGVQAAGPDHATQEQLSRAERHAEAAENLLGADPRAVLGDALDGLRVLIVRTSDASNEDVTATRTLLSDVGARDAGSISLTDLFVSREGADELRSIVANTLPAGAQLSVDNLSPGTHAGQALGAALRPDASADDRILLLDALAQGGYLSYDAEVSDGADAVLVVGAPSGDDAAFAQKMLDDFVTALGSNGRAAARDKEGVDTVAGRFEAVHNLASSKSQAGES